MAFQVNIPESAELGSEITLISWIVKEGDHVNSGDAIAEIEADKGVIDIEAPVEGTLFNILVKEGETVQPGTVIGYLGAPDQQIPEQIPSARPGQVRAVPAARKLAASLKVDLSTIKGSGPGGLITKEDVLSTGDGIRESQSKAISSNQKAVAKKVLQSHREIPAVRFAVQVDMSRAIPIKERGFSYDAIFIYTAGRILKEFPLLYSTLKDDVITTAAEVNIALAVGVGDELYAPVIRGADKNSIKEIDKIVLKLTQKAREHTLIHEDMSYGHFLISNLGMYPIDNFEAIVYPGQAASLAVGAITPTPIVVEDKVVIRPVLSLTLCIDHRLINGKLAAQFLTRTKKFLEEEIFEK